MMQETAAKEETQIRSESGRSPGEENVNPLQYSCLENPMGRGAWQATVHGITKNWMPLSNYAHKGDGRAHGGREGGETTEAVPVSFP